MKYTTLDLKGLPDGIKKLNPNLFDLAGRVETAEREPNPKPALERKPPAKQGARTVMVVRIVTFTRHVQDDDNHQSGCKGLRDIISRWLGIDDGDARIRFEYAQVRSLNRQGTMVLIHCELL